MCIKNDGSIKTIGDLMQYLIDSTNDPEHSLEEKLQQVLIFTYHGRLFIFAADLIATTVECGATNLGEIISNIDAWADIKLSDK